MPPSCLICPDGGGSEYTHQAKALPREELLKEDYNDLENRSHPFTRIVCYPSPGGHHNERTLQSVSRSSLLMSRILPTPGSRLKWMQPVSIPTIDCVMPTCVLRPSLPSRSIPRLPSDVARLSAGLAAVAGRRSHTRGDFSADVAP